MALIQVFRNATRKDDNGEVIHNGDDNFYTEADGKGDKVYSVASVGGGKYYLAKRNKEDAEPVFTDAERKQMQIESFMYQVVGADRTDAKGQEVFRPGRLVKILEAMDGLIDQIKKHDNKKLKQAWTQENAQNIVGHLVAKISEVENALSRAPQTPSAIEI